MALTNCTSEKVTVVVTCSLFLFIHIVLSRFTRSLFLFIRNLRSADVNLVLLVKQGCVMGKTPGKILLCRCADSRNFRNLGL